MLIYAIYAVRLNVEKTRITEVMWQELQATQSFAYNPEQISLNQVVEALSTENKVYLLLQNDSGEWVNTFAEFKLVTYSENEEIGIYNPEYNLVDLPNF